MKNKEGAGILFTDGIKILLLKRSEKGDNYGTWCLPGGGVEKGETPIIAAKRESIEECGKLKGKKFEKIKHSDNWTTFFFKINKTFLCNLSDEHSDYKWFDLNELNKINLHPKLKKSINQYLNIIKNHFSNFKEWIKY
jgi:8-oxo-dGTP pyrophosphatase MutT (NUDIX family)